MSEQLKFVSTGRSNLKNSEEKKVKKAEQAIVTSKSKIAKLQSTEDKLVELFRGVIKKEDWYYSKEDNKFFRKERTGALTGMKWYPVTGVFKGRITADASEQWWEAMSLEGRMKDCIVNTVRDDVPNTQFNTIDKADWLQPADDGEENEWIKLLLRSLSNDDDDIKDYIEHIVAYKYLHPEDYKIPCLWFYGEGGAGKNTFVQQLLATVFSPAYIEVVDGSVFEGFNGQLLGKVVAMLDESKVDKKTFNHFKRWVGNQSIFINQKFGAANSYEHTLLWIAGGNGFDAAPPLSGDTSDRRWAPIRVDKNIMEYVAEEYDVSYDKKGRRGDAVQLYNDNEKFISDKEVVAKWLRYIILKHGRKGRPEALVTEDMAEIARAHNRPHINFFEDAFQMEDGQLMFFAEGSVVTTDSLHSLYTIWMSEKYPRGMTINDVHFGRSLVDWARQSHTPITRIRVNIKGGGRRTGWIMIVSEAVDVKSISVTATQLIDNMTTVNRELIRD